MCLIDRPLGESVLNGKLGVDNVLGLEVLCGHDPHESWLALKNHRESPVIAPVRLVDGDSVSAPIVDS
jgi:hypothetical protein